MDVDRALVKTLPNGLSYIDGAKDYTICQKCKQHCEIIVRAHLGTSMRYLSDCCSAHVNIGDKEEAKDA